MPATEIVVVLTAVVGGAFTAVTVAIRSLQWQLRETRAWAEASEKRADVWAGMVMDLVSRKLSASRRSASS